jgi:hypothetical protein
VAVLDNGSFETAGATPGAAASWTLTASTPLPVVATFNGGVGASVSLEQFDVGWLTDAYLLEPSTGTPTVFSDATPVDTESFDDWNGGKPYAFDVATGVQMEFTSDNPPFVLVVEDFDEGWGTATWTEEPSAGATFEEHFDTGWSTDTWLDDVLSGTNAMFDAGTNATESFENSWPDILFVADDTTDLCTAFDMPSFGPPANNFKITVVTTGAYPGGITENQPYYLRNVTPSGGGFTFNLSKTSGGASINITDAGIGSHYIHADESVYWTKFEE